MSGCKKCKSGLTDIKNPQVFNFCTCVRRLWRLGDPRFYDHALGKEWGHQLGNENDLAEEGESSEEPAPNNIQLEFL